MFLFVTMLLLSSPLRAEEEQPLQSELSLAQAIEQALTYNRTMDNVKRSITEAELTLRATGKERLPKIQTNYSYMRTLNNFSINGEYQVDPDSPEMSLFSMTFPQDNYSWTTWFTVPLWSRVQDLSEDIARLGIDVAKVSLLQAKNELLTNVKSSYYTILRDEQYTGFLEQNLKSCREHEKLTGQYFTQGLVAKNSVMEAQVESANASQELQTARQNHVISQATLVTFMGIPDKNRVFRLSEKLERRKLDMTLEQCLEYARVHNPEMVAFTFLKRQADKAIALEKASYAPTLSMSAYYMAYGDKPGLQNSQGEGFPSSTLAAMFSINWLLTDWGQKSDEAKIKKSRLEQIKNNEMLTNDRISLRIRETFSQFKTSELNLETSELAIVAAKENLRLANLRYREQAATSREVIDAMTSLKRAEFNYYSALYIQNIALTRLEEAMGSETDRIVLSQKDEKKLPDLTKPGDKR
jgi:outer membrane protein TolC